jgi:predicted nucleic acid-binding protein
MTSFVDTSALYAVLDADDAFHPAARASWDRILSGSEELITSNYVLVETAALAQARLGREGAAALFRVIVPALEVEWVTPADHAAAVSAWLAARRRGLSLVDCASFEVMRRLGLRRAFAFDRHFEQEGFERVK